MSAVKSAANTLSVNPIWTTITLLSRGVHFLHKYVWEWRKFHYLGFIKCFQGLFFVKTESLCCVHQKKKPLSILLNTFAYKVKEETTQFTLIACSLSPGLMQTSWDLPPPFDSPGCLCWALNRVALNLLQASAALSHTHIVLLVLIHSSENVKMNNVYIGVIFHIMALCLSEHFNEMEHTNILTSKSNISN